MGNRKRFLLLIAAIPLVIIIAILYGQSREKGIGVRGKSPAYPIETQLDPAQELAQDLALSDPRVQDLTIGRPSEVFGVREVGAHFGPDNAACAVNACWQVEIYNFDEDATVTAVIDVDTPQVLAVYHQPGVHPGINARLIDLAKEIAFEDPAVIEALGFSPTSADMAPVDAGLVDSVCETGHLCVSPTFNLDGEILWAVVDLTEGRLAGLARTERRPDPPGNAEAFVGLDCPVPGSIDRSGWSVYYEVAATDGLRVYNVTYQNIPVITSSKLVEWHVDYGDSGFEDVTGCGGGGGGFPIFPYGETEIFDLVDGGLNVVGFEVVQDFRMNQWGNFCNYRYDQRFQFFNDGRFRVVSGAYGKGCGTEAVYRPVVRMDLAVHGDAADTFYRWSGAEWTVIPIEDYFVPYPEAGHGPHEATGEGYNWIVSDDSGAGYYVEMSTGQFDDGGRGDDPFVYVTKHNPAEGDTDIGVIGDCCFDDHRQGPEGFLNGESVQGENLVLWYVPQLVTDGDPGSYYCWTVSGEPNPETYPCWAGPMFIPFDQTITADFDHDGPAGVGETVAFTNTSTSLASLSFDWDFGDGSPHSATENPTHIYNPAGYYTVTLTVSNTVATAENSQVIAVGVPPIAAVGQSLFNFPGQPVQFINHTIGGADFVWDFGDGSPPSMEANPSHIYATAGTYNGSLRATNAFGSDQVAFTVVVGYPVILPFVER